MSVSNLAKQVAYAAMPEIDLTKPTLDQDSIGLVTPLLGNPIGVSHDVENHIIYFGTGLPDIAGSISLKPSRYKNTFYIEKIQSNSILKQEEKGSLNTNPTLDAILEALEDAGVEKSKLMELVGYLNQAEKKNGYGESVNVPLTDGTFTLNYSGHLFTDQFQVTVRLSDEQSAKLAQRAEEKLTAAKNNGDGQHIHRIKKKLDAGIPLRIEEFTKNTQSIEKAASYLAQHHAEMLAATPASEWTAKMLSDLKHIAQMLCDLQVDGNAYGRSDQVTKMLERLQGPLDVAEKALSEADTPAGREEIKRALLETLKSQQKHATVGSAR